MSNLTPDEVMTVYVKNRIKEWRELTRQNRAHGKPGQEDDVVNAKAEQVIDDLAILSSCMNSNPDEFIFARDVLYTEMKKDLPIAALLLFNPNQEEKAPELTEV